MLAPPTLESGEYSSSLEELAGPEGGLLLALQLPRARATQLALLVYLLRWGHLQLLSSPWPPGGAGTAPTPGGRWPPP